MIFGELEREIARLRAENERLRAAVKELVDKPAWEGIQKLEAEIERLRAEVELLQNKLRASEQLKRGYFDDNDLLRAEVERLHAENERLTAELVRTISDVDCRVIENGRLRAEVERLRAALKDIADKGGWSAENCIAKARAALEQSGDTLEKQRQMHADAIRATAEREQTTVKELNAQISERKWQD